MIKMAQSTINEDERKRILYQSLMVNINFNFVSTRLLFVIVYILLNLGVERCYPKVKFNINLFTIYKLCLYGRCVPDV